MHLDKTNKLQLSILSQKFREICNEPSHPLDKTMKFDKSEFRGFLLKRYPSNVADVFLSYFGLTMTWDFDEFVEAMEIFINLSKDVHYKIAFEAYDFNADGLISEYDLFMAMRMFQSELFVNTLSSDITTILKLIKEKKHFKVKLCVNF
jgi:Ca2+-binding EF-hand superfamily protein